MNLYKTHPCFLLMLSKHRGHIFERDHLQCLNRKINRDKKNNVFFKINCVTLFIN
jgi:hypothetical protein